MEDLWPKDIIESKLRAPVTILKEQASILGEKTRNIVEAETEKISNEHWMKEGGFAYSFYIVGKIIDYRFNLFKFSHGVSMYPLSIKLDDDILAEIKKDYKINIYGAIEVESESDLLEALKRIFNSVKTRRVVQAILAQSES